MYRVLRFLFPDRCVGCLRVGDLLCPDCLVKIPSIPSPLCSGCLRESNYYQPHLDCRRRDTPDFLLVPFGYQGVVRKMIKTGKFHRDQRLFLFLTRLLIEEIEELSELYHFLTKRRPLVVPVPMAKRGFRQRGFNQAAVIGKEIASHWQLRFTDQILLKQDRVLSQVLLPARKRKQNVQRVFSVNKSLLKSEKNVVLVDDVVTTGATLRACTEILRRAGVKRIGAIVLAH